MPNDTELEKVMQRSRSLSQSQAYLRFALFSLSLLTLGLLGKILWMFIWFHITRSFNIEFF